VRLRIVIKLGFSSVCRFEMLTHSRVSGTAILGSSVARVGWVIWPVKIVPKMTYKVSSGTSAVSRVLAPPPLQGLYIPIIISIF